MEIELGKAYRDTITGLVGIAIGEVHYLGGCNQVLLIPNVDKEGRRLSGEWFNVQRLEIVKAKPVELGNRRTPGPDMLPPER